MERLFLSGRLGLVTVQLLRAWAEQRCCDHSGPVQPPAQPAIRRHSWSLQSPSSPGVPGLSPSGLSMSPPAVVAGASSAASRAAYDTGALRRLSLRSGQSEGEEVILSKPSRAL